MRNALHALSLLLGASVIMASACSTEEEPALAASDGATPRGDAAGPQGDAGGPALLYSDARVEDRPATAGDVSLAPHDAAIAFVAPDPASGDPGSPNIVRGIKADAHLFIGTREVGYIFFAALMPKQEDQAHIYADPASGTLGLSEYYLSLVMDRSRWRVGEYTMPVGGRVRFALSDGTTYSASASTDSLSVRFNITGLSTTDPELYPAGTFELTIPSSSPNLLPLVVKGKFN